MLLFLFLFFFCYVVLVCYVVSFRYVFSFRFGFDRFFLGVEAFFFTSGVHSFVILEEKFLGAYLFFFKAIPVFPFWWRIETFKRWPREACR